MKDQLVEEVREKLRNWIMFQDAYRRCLEGVRHELAQNPDWLPSKDALLSYLQDLFKQCAERHGLPYPETEFGSQRRLLP